jgi:TetR/AcrR family transcriptional repressor of nem operon
VAEACAEAFDAAVVNLGRIARLATASARARLLIDSYLSTHHRDNRGSGCLIVAVGADMARLTGAAREGFARGFAVHLERLESALRLAPDAVENHDRVTHLMSALVGTLLFARATSDPARSDALLASARRMLRHEFCT